MKKDSNIKILEKQSIQEKIKIIDNQFFEYYLIAFDWSNIDLEFIWNCRNSTSKINILLVSNKKDWIQCKINNRINWNGNKIDVNIVWLVWNNWSIKADWNIEVNINTNWNDCNLSEETIFLEEKWNCKMTPQLIIKSNNVKATHWAKIHRLPTDKINYMSTKWLSKDTIKKLLIESYINKLMPELFDQQDKIVWYLI